MIELVEVTKIYPDGTEAVKSLSFEVNKGDTCVLLGPSGCGKTTAMKLINRLVPATGGKIYVDGVDNSQIDQNELRRSIGFAIQDVGLFPHMTVGQNIETVPALKGWSKKKRRDRAAELLRLLRLDPDEFLDKYPNELSGGQRQRVGVARALGADPPILLMDEPFGAIDPITRVELQNEFLKIQQELKKTVIFVTHDIGEALKLADTIALMKSGVLMQYGPPIDMMFDPHSEFVKDFISGEDPLKALQLLSVEKVMSVDGPTVQSEESPQSVLNRMKYEGLNRMPVVDDDNRYLGMISRRALKKGEFDVEAAKKEFASAGKTMTVDEALTLMLKSGQEYIAVIDEKSGRFEGLVSFALLQEKLKSYFS